MIGFIPLGGVLDESATELDDFVLRRTRRVCAGVGGDLGAFTGGGVAVGTGVTPSGPLGAYGYEPGRGCDDDGIDSGGNCCGVGCCGYEVGPGAGAWLLT